MAKVIVIQFPGVNCEYETLRAIEAAGLTGEIRRWNVAKEHLGDAAAIVIPGGFSYQDRIRAGVVASKDPVVDAVMSAVDRGVPVLGICNGAQILVETGVVPAFSEGSVEVALAPNRMTGRHGYYCAWVHVKKGPANCVFTDFMDGGDGLPLPLAHAEGRFVTASPQAKKRLEAGHGVAVVYSAPDGKTAEAFPENPNGSMLAIAGLTNATGNVLALMPHPERAAWFHQVPRHVGGVWGRKRDSLVADQLFSPGPGAGYFTSLKRAL
ncbi:MAG: phosphoribosylformylglycinamidine synthase I [Candidatus Krumholzibacteria bacterium]|nr:phosphoribosylformylglycinamidine synthase I [Candidatus Krumholzibacteria bacterium]